MSTPKLTFNPFSGTFDYTYPEDHHGGYTEILEGRTVSVEEYKIIFAHLDIVIEGALVLNGTLTVI